MSELVIDAPPEAVWKAITDARELARWFPLDASTTPGAGGTLVYEWGDLKFVNRIEVWEPGKHLRMTWGHAEETPGPAVGPGAAPAPGASAPGPADAERRRLTVDWYIEGREGRTVLRLVHSGFGHDASWDSEYDGTRRGWIFELSSLRQYLEKHAGRDRAAFWVQRPFAPGAAGAWARMTGAGGLFSSGSVAGLGVGDRCSLTMATGERLEGRAILNAPPVEFAATVENLGDAMMRFGFEDCGGGPVAHLWLSLWGRPKSEAQAIEERWRGLMTRLFS
jgi:uncharacterized protein YndB with AHSA1/START domain